MSDPDGGPGRLIYGPGEAVRNPREGEAPTEPPPINSPGGRALPAGRLLVLIFGRSGLLIRGNARAKASPSQRPDNITGRAYQ